MNVNSLLLSFNSLYNSFVNYNSGNQIAASSLDYSNLINNNSPCQCLMAIGDDIKIPVVSSLGDIIEGIPKLPKIDLISGKELKSRLDIVEDEIFYTNTTYQQILERKNKKFIASKETADLLVRALKNEPAFAWDYLPDGCLYKSELAKCVIGAMRIDKESLKTKMLFKKHSGKIFRGEEFKWKFHQAASITLSDLTELVIDPSINAEAAQTLLDWNGASGFAVPETIEEDLPIFTTLRGKATMPCHAWKALDIYRRVLEHPARKLTSNVVLRDDKLKTVEILEKENGQSQEVGQSQYRLI